MVAGLLVARQPAVNKSIKLSHLLHGAKLNMDLLQVSIKKWKSRTHLTQENDDSCQLISGVNSVSKIYLDNRT